MWRQLKQRQEGACLQNLAEVGEARTAPLAYRKEVQPALDLSSGNNTQTAYLIFSMCMQQIQQTSDMIEAPARGSGGVQLKLLL